MTTDKRVKWDDPLSFSPDNPGDFANITKSNALSKLYDSIKNTRGWKFKYRVDYNKTKIIALRIFADAPSTGVSDPVFIGGVTIIAGRSGDPSYGITSNRIHNKRAPAAGVGINTKLVNVDHVARAVSVIKQYCYPETVEERAMGERLQIERLKADVTSKIYKEINAKISDVIGINTKSEYYLGLDEAAGLQKSIIDDIFNDYTLDVLRNKYEAKYQQHQQIKEMHARYNRVINMLEKVHRVHSERGLMVVRTMHGSVMGPAVEYKTFTDMPEKIRNAVAALRMLGEGFHEDIGVNLDNGDVFWVYGND